MGNLVRKALLQKQLRREITNLLTSICHPVNCRTYYGL
jgi:hypothetical protein